MGNQDKQLKRALGIRYKAKEGEPTMTFLKDSKLFEGLKKDWYLSSWFEKFIFILGFVALIYSIIRIVAQGIW